MLSSTGRKRPRAIHVWTMPDHKDAWFGEGLEAGAPGRCGILNLEPGMMDDYQAQGQKYKASRGCGVLDPVWTMSASLQVSRAIAYQGISPAKIDGCNFASEGITTRAGGAPGQLNIMNTAGRDVAMPVMEFNNVGSVQFPGAGSNSDQKYTSLHPSTGRWNLPNAHYSGRMPIVHPSVGSFKTDRVNFSDFECAGCPELERHTGNLVSRCKILEFHVRSSK